MHERGAAAPERGEVPTVSGVSDGPAAAFPGTAAAEGFDATGRGLDDLAGAYEILGELGRGGSAVVYRARDRRLLREVALKVVRLAPTLNARERAAEVTRLSREARTVARLQHPHIVAVYAVHELGDGLAVSMQYVPGRTLKQAVAEDGAFASERAVRVMREVAAALAHAHAHGVVHRDVKPENIFLDGVTGRALLADFGAARAGEIDVRVTRTGATVGTPAYMSPEQIDGGPVDARSDLYSLGLVAWEMLTGHRPWDHAGLYQVLHHQKYDTLPPVACVRPASAPPVPLAVEYVVDRLLEKRPGARWADADALVAQLERPVLPGDFKLWERTHRRRIAAHGRSGSSAAGGGALTFTAPTEQFRPGRHGSATTRTPEADGDLTAGNPDAPSWVHDRPPSSGRWWYGGALAGALVVAVSFALARYHAPGEGASSTVALRAPEPSTGRGQQPAGPTSGADSALGGVAAGAAVPGAAAADSSRPAPATDSSAITAGTAGSMGAAPNRPSTVGGVPLLGPAASASAVAMGDTVHRIAIPAGPAPAPGDPRPDSRPAIAAAPIRPAPLVAPPVATTAAAATEAARAPVLAERTVVAAGARHTCAIDAGGRALCWGANDSGQLGTGDLAAYDAPAFVTGDVRFGQLATGGSHSCGLTPAGEAYCWGDDDHGQLGDAASSTRNAPVRVAGGGSYRSLRAGLDYTCALSLAGAVVCWGDNSRGQLGDGTARSRATPAAVRGLRAAALAAGWRHSCALTPDGAALCWGENADGQLGDGTRVARPTPVAVAGGHHFLAIAAGASHTCAVTTGGETYCWGVGGTDRSPHPTPVRVDAPASFSTLAAGSVHTCGRTSAGAVYCWGRNPYGQLGDGTTADHWRPVRVPGGPFTSVSAAGAHTCALADGAPVCWGYNVSGQLGDGTRTHHASPTRVARAAS